MPVNTHRLSVKVYWEMWHLGHPCNKTPPYKMLKAYDLKQDNIKAEKGFLSKMKKVVSTIDRVVNELDEDTYPERLRLEKNMSVWSVSDRDTVFRSDFETMMTSVNAKEDRCLSNICIGTVYRDVIEHEKQSI